MRTLTVLGVVLFITGFFFAHADSSSSAAVVAAVPAALPVAASSGGVSSFFSSLLGFVMNAAFLSGVAYVLSKIPGPIPALLKKVVDFASANLQHPQDK